MPFAIKKPEPAQLSLDALAALAPILIIVVLPAIDLSLRNLKILGLYAAHFFPLAGIAAAVFAFALALAFVRKRHSFFDFLFSAYLGLAPFWILHVFLRPWIGGSAAFAGIGLAAALFAALLGMKRGARDLWVFASAAFGAGLLVLAGVNSYALIDESGDWQERDDRAHGSKRAVRATYESQVENLPDIYHLVFDEFQTDLFEAVATSEDRDALAGFSFFPNASTPFGRTDMALGAVFSGRPYMFRGEPYSYIEEAFNGETSLLTALKKRGYHTTGIVHKVYPSRSPTPFDHTYQHIRHADVGRVSGQGQLFRALWIVSQFPERVARLFVNAEEIESLGSQTLLPATYSYFSALSVRRYMRENREWNFVNPRYVFVHLVIPHAPVVLNEECAEKGEGVATIQEQTRCALMLAREFIEMLKKEGRFEDSLILIHGDHGAKYSWDGEELSGVRSRREIEWHVGRSRPLLLVKPAGIGDVVPLRIDSRSADLFDLYPTVMEAAEIPNNGDSGVVGESLTRPATRSRSRYYHFYEKDVDWRKLIRGKLARYSVSEEGLIFLGEQGIQREEAELRGSALLGTRLLRADSADSAGSADSGARRSEDPRVYPASGIRRSKD